MSTMKQSDTTSYSLVPFTELEHFHTMELIAARLADMVDEGQEHQAEYKALFEVDRKMS